MILAAFFTFWHQFSLFVLKMCSPPAQEAQFEMGQRFQGKVSQKVKLSLMFPGTGQRFQGRVSQKVKLKVKLSLMFPGTGFNFLGYSTLKRCPVPGPRPAPR